MTEQMTEQMTEKGIHATTTSMTTETNNMNNMNDTNNTNNTNNMNDTNNTNNMNNTNNTNDMNKTVSNGFDKDILENIGDGAFRRLMNDESLISRNMIRHILVSCANSAPSKQAFLLSAKHLKDLTLHRTDVPSIDELYFDSVIITIVDMNIAHGWWEE